MVIRFYNTLSRKKEVFKPIRKNSVGLYTCGPTVYYFAHIGNLKTYIFEDLLRRTLEYNGYRVKQVMNITDVGHLTGDRDMGEDKLEKEAKKERKSAWDLARFYAKAFFADTKKLNILPPHKTARATVYIKGQIKLVQILEKKGYTYQTRDGIYFDTSKLKDYGKLAKQNLKELKEGARVEKNPEKRNPTDFALWKFAKPGEKRQMEWASPWGKHSFPGWHIECSAISTHFLGQPFDIHTGGVDHIPIHHTNEIAQSESAYGKPLARYWLHGEFLVLDKARMGKSEGNIITLQKLIDKGFNPLSYRYLTLGAHYRSKLKFTWKALLAAERGLDNLYHEIALLNFLKNKKTAGKTALKKKFEKDFLEAINNDLDIPRALAVLQNLLRSNLSPAIKLELAFEFDKVLGLELKRGGKIPKLPTKVSAQADRLRKRVEALGYTIEDTPEGPFLWLKRI
ncbi:MAG: cysteine--tRNA ligase [Candidatus Colwellbacteria bacterium]|nr:cysteine--tRNA ligase [Candidatus Colwellbacteria bacterium]